MFPTDRGLASYGRQLRSTRRERLGIKDSGPSFCCPSSRFLEPCQFCKPFQRCAGKILRCNGSTPVLRPRLRPPFLSTKDSTGNRRDHRRTSTGPFSTRIPLPVFADLAFRSIRL